MSMMQEVEEYANERITKYTEIRKERDLTQAELDDFNRAIDTRDLIKSSRFVSRARIDADRRKYPNLYSFYD